MSRPAWLFLGSCLNFGLLTAQTYDIATFAGGVNGLGATAYFTISAVALDQAGNAFVSLPGVHFVAKLDPSGGLTRVAGNGAAGYSGDGGSALDAQLDYPS